MTFKLRAVGMALMVTALVVGVAAVPAAGAPIVRNGDFERGNRVGWTVSDLGSGRWRVYDDPSVIDPTVIEPPQGKYAIVTVQPGPGSHVLSQVVRLPEDVRLELKFVLWYASEGTITVPDPDTLRHDGDANQQFRVDVIKPAANVRTLRPGAILATVFRTRVGDPQTMSRTTITKRLTSLGGQEVRLRFVEVDNLGVFTVVIDRVRIVVG